MYELQVNLMICDGCAKTITKLVQSVDSNAKVDVDLAGKRVRVESNANLKAIAAAISGAGYPVTTSAAV